MPKRFFLSIFEWPLKTGYTVFIHEREMADIIYLYYKCRFFFILRSYATHRFKAAQMFQSLRKFLRLYRTAGCPSLSCPLDSLPSGGQPNRGGLAPPPGGKLSRDILPPTLVIFTPGGKLFRDILPPPWLSSTPGGKLSRPVYLAPHPTQVKIYTCYFVIFLYHFNEFRFSISHKVRNWCLWG